MKKYPKSILILAFILPLIPLVFSSCVSPAAHLTGKVDPHFTFDKSQSIHIALLESANIEDKQFHHQLVKEMKQAGFQIANEWTRDTLALFFNLNTDRSLVQSILVLPDSTTTTGRIGMKSFSATTEGTQVVPYSKYISIKRIQLALFRITKKEKLDLVWEGHLGTRQENLRYGASPAIRQLIKVIGENFEGPVEMPEQSDQRSQDSNDVKQLEHQVKTLQAQIQELQGKDRKLTGSNTVHNEPEPLKQENAKLAQDCQQERLDACVELAARYQVGEGVPKNLKTAVSLYDKGCEGNNAKACAGLGMLYAKGSGVQVDKERAKNLLSKACDNGFAKACFILGGLFKSGEVGRKDEVQSVKLFEKACEGGDGMGCTSLAFNYLMGKVGQIDHKRAMALLEQGCQFGEPFACGSAAMRYRIGLSVQKDTKKSLSLQKNAFPLYQKGCQEGDASYCGAVGAYYEGRIVVPVDMSAVGAYYEEGGVVPVDMSQALLHYEKACKGGSLSGCVRLGNLYLEGNKVPKDHLKAVQIYSKACETKELASWEGREAYWKSSCYRNLASLYENGEGLSTEKAHAATYYRKACDLGDESSCIKLGLITFEEDSLGSTNKTNNLPLLRKGCNKYYDTANTCQQFEATLVGLCEKEDLKACRELSDSYWEGRLNPKKAPISVASLDKRLCDEGTLESCYRLASHFTFGSTRDITRAEELHVENCQDGYLDSCKSLAGLALEYLEGLGNTPVDPVKAGQLLKLSCDGGVASSCRQLGELYEEGEGVKQDYTSAEKAYKVACDKGDAMGCDYLASLFKKGYLGKMGKAEIAALYSRAVALYQKGCEKGKDLKRIDRYDSDWDCYRLASHYERGLGVSRDELKASIVYKQACGRELQEACKIATSFYVKDCEKGQVSDCTILGKMYLNGRILEKDTQRAMDFFQQACDGKDGKGCYYLGSIHVNEKGKLYQPEKAQSYFEMACDFGHTLGCRHEKAK